jgi:quinol-cytochrome oxidoreductase complex cytochrome b subunit
MAKAQNMALTGALLGGAWLLIGLQVIVGVALSGKYEPTLEAAHASVAAIERTSGWGYVAAFHYWGSAFTILALVAAIFAMLLGGNVRKETKWLWWTAIALAGLVIAIQVTGNALPASQHDVRTVNIEAGIAGGVPKVGPAFRAAVLGGDRFAQSTLDRWYSLHRFVLPLAILLTTLAGLWASKKTSLKIHPLGAILPAVLALIAAATFGLPFGGQATAADYTASGTNPMWYVYPNHALLMLFGRFAPSAQWIGAMLLPVLGGLILVALPLFSKDGRIGRWLGIAGIVLIAAACLLAGTPVHNPIAEAPATQEPKTDTRDFGPIDSPLAGKGQQLFTRENCMNCHRVGERGKSDTGPNLAGVGKRQADPQWYVDMLKDPSSKGRTTIPAFDDLQQDELRALAEYLRSLKD